MRNKEIPRQPLTSVRQTKIIDVWAHNFVAELKEISELLEEFNVVAMDTEFPGVKEYPVSGLEDKEYEYYQVYNNVKNFKLIQIGLNLANERGEVPSIKNTWQFHFKFSTNQGDKIIENVQAMLESAGIDFKELDNNGIDQDVFCDYITSSGLILNDDVKYIVFHGQFDFGYLLNLFHHSGIPEKSDEFLTLMKQYFPQVYDLKYAIRDNPKFKDIGLSKLAYKIDVHRIGPEHQAGSDALLTMQCYQQMKMLPEFEYEIGQMDKNMNIIYGIGKGYLNNTRRKPYGQSNNQTPDIQLQQNQQQQQQQYYDYQPYYDQQYDPFLYYNLQSYYPQQFQQIQEQDIQKRKGMQY